MGQEKGGGFWAGDEEGGGLQAGAGAEERRRSPGRRKELGQEAAARAGVQQRPRLLLADFQNGRKAATGANCSRVLK